MPNGIPRFAVTRGRTVALIAILTALSAVALWIVLPRSAAAAPVGSSFSCRASALRVALTGLPVLEPFIANSPDAPCAPDQNNILQPTTEGPVAVNAVNVATDQKPVTLGPSDLADGDGAAASSTITNPTVTLGALTVHADVLTAAATITCKNGLPVADSSGTVVGLTINGQTTTVPPGTNQSISLGPLGTLALNEVDTSASQITRRAVDLTTPLGEVVISEATTDISGNPCEKAPPPAPPAPPPPPPPPPAPVPPPAPPVSNVKAAQIQAPGIARLEVLPPAVGRLIARGACVRGSFLARVVGRRIARVVFALDGNRAGVAVHAPFQTSLTATPGPHLLLAYVTFVKASSTAPKMFRLPYIGCSPIPPSFTG